MDVAAILQEVREDFLDDAVAPYRWAEATLLRYLSRAQEEACLRQRILVDEATAEICSVTLQDGVASYSLDPRIILIERIQYGEAILAKRTKPQLDRIKPGWELCTGPVDSYLQNDLTITLLPTPTAADDGQTLALRVWRMPLVPFTATDQVPEIPAPYHRDLMWYAIAEAFNRPDEDTQDTRRADEHMARFNRVFGTPMRADVLAHRRREADASFIGAGHAYHGRSSTRMSAERAFDFED